MKTVQFGKSIISDNHPCYVIAEIGHNHQGELDKALEMIKVAAECGVNAVKFQKRNNKNLYTKKMYNKPYDSENSYGATYGLHRDFLEFGKDEYVKLKKYADECGVEFLCTPFDYNSVTFLEELGVNAYKIASGDLTNLPFLTYIAKLGKPMIVSTGAASLYEIRQAYETILEFNNDLCLLHCVAAYPAECKNLNLNTITTLKKEFPKAVIGYSGHDNGILAGVLAYMLGANIVEKHFTLCRAWKGTDQKFSLEPNGLRKQVRDLRRVDISLGSGEKILQDFEQEARIKMGKSIYTAQPLKAGEVLSEDNICFKSPAHGLPPYRVKEVLGKRLKTNLNKETLLSMDHLRIN